MKNRLLLPLVATVAAVGGWAAAVRSTAAAEFPQLPTLENACDLDLQVTASARASGGLWIHPGVRNLEPGVFGTADLPLGHEFEIGVPIYNRLDNGNGAWTTTALPGPASNNTTALASDAVATVSVVDRTPVDLRTFTSPSQDQISLRVEFTDPWGRAIRIVSYQPLPRGPFHQFWGGVATNVFLHGRTGIGGKMVPQTFAYLATWGRGEIYINDQLLPGNDNRIVHAMITHGVRDAANAPGLAGGNGPFLGTDAEVDREDLEFHILLPPVRFVPTPQPNSPVLGFPQEFVHVVFEDVRISGSSLNGVLQR